MANQRQITAIESHLAKWRESQQLSPLDQAELHEAAKTFIAQKGLALPSKITQGETYYLLNGEYVMKDALDNVPVMRSPALISVVDSLPESQAADNPRLPNGKWNYLYKGVLFCPRIGCEVKFCDSPEMIAGDPNRLKYYVKTIGAGTYDHRYAVMENELTLPIEEDERKVSDRLELNIATWTEIKNFLTQFANSYPWNKDGERSPTEVRDHVLAEIKSPKQGLAKLIEIERKKYPFDGRDEFISRMTDLYASFPWSAFVQLCDFSRPMV